ncbi:MAG TPA: hypothetical protein VHP33_28500 [Polyangiaceae bacterium]|nr:hypothetical protein [Polyangiaceae bacterium]
MRTRRSAKLILTSALLAATSLLGGCSSDTTSDAEDHGALTTAGGVEIPYQSVRCIYRQNTGSNDTLSLQLQYLDTPDTVAFALYINDPKPARPFRATPGEAVELEWGFEAALDGTMYTAGLNGGQATLSLDALPAPSTLVPGETVRLHGRLDINDVSLSSPSIPGGSAGTPLELAASSVPVDCEASYQESMVFD